jgi:hypothetical protein
MEFQRYFHHSSRIIPMLKKFRIPALFLLLSLSAVAAALQQTQKQKEEASRASYDRLWVTADSLAAKGLYKSAGETVTGIYKKARTEGNMPQVVKAALYRSRFQNMEGREGLVSVIRDLEEDCKTVAFPAAPVLHSILAEVYWRYYEQNRFRFLSRTETSGITEDDIRTWDLKKILQKTVEHYRASLEPASTLKVFPVDAFDLVITPGKPANSRELRPLLYDFLAHRAIDFYSNAEADLSQAGPSFEISKQAYFVNAKQFHRRRNRI